MKEVGKEKRSKYSKTSNLVSRATTRPGARDWSLPVSPVESWHIEIPRISQVVGGHFSVHAHTCARTRTFRITLAYHMCEVVSSSSISQITMLLPCDFTP